MKSEKPVKRSAEKPAPQTIAPPPEGLQSNPISQVKWVHRSELHANGYNPNHVAKPELALLIRSIMEAGWTQPIVRRTDGEIVDGFHRWTVSGTAEVYARDGGYVPVVTLSDSRSLEDQKIDTIRHNRARGVHGIMPMAKIVRDLVGAGLSYEEIQARVGMEEEEVERLHTHAGMPSKVAGETPDFAKAWVPTRDRP